jgi:4-amino-4-deoxy-L-arabinose transferase-like glycosyltransferase
VSAALGAVAIGLPVAAVSAFLRFWDINSVGFNSDEAVYAGQGASIAGVSELKHFFPIFRAHPLLYQTILSAGFAAGAGDRFSRVLTAIVGLVTIGLVYLVGKDLYNRRTGVIAAIFLGVMPYHVLVTRQVLLDAPEAMFSTLTLLLLAKYALTRRSAWLYATGGALGLTFLSKEVGLLFIVAVYAFLALSPGIRVRLGDLVRAAAVMVLVILPYPLSLAFAGKSHTGSQFLSYQLFRRPNHSLLFYPTNVSEAVGPALLVAAALGLWLLRKQGTWRETLLVAWVAVPAVFFEIWPVKGFQYLLPAAPPLAILAARTFGYWPASLSYRRLRAEHVALIGAALVAVTLVVPAWGRIQPSTSGKFLAGSGGVRGGREAGHWINDNIPEGAEMLAIGPSMANIIEFYGHRKVYGLSVSPNPLHRNPVYEPVNNPDLQIRHSDLQYLVWDSYSASRSKFFGEKIRKYADRYNGRVIHTETVPVTTRDGTTVRKPVIVIYSVRP